MYVFINMHMCIENDKNELKNKNKNKIKTYKNKTQIKILRSLPPIITNFIYFHH